MSVYPAQNKKRAERKIVRPVRSISGIRTFPLRRRILEQELVKGEDALQEDKTNVQVKHNARR